jgi:hypothetical protein
VDQPVPKIKKMSREIFPKDDSDYIFATLVPYQGGSGTRKFKPTGRPTRNPAKFFLDSG